MTRYLLDTNIISMAVKVPGGPVDDALRAHRSEEIGTSLVVRGEILFGLAKKKSVRGRERLDRVLRAIEVWSLDAPIDEIYGALRADVELNGRPMGANDLWIAAHALALDAVLVTDDHAFQRVRGLRVENWLKT